MTHDLLFLCTGNYYRSRFCEEYFNHQARRQGLLSWRADSRGLAPDITVFRNPGPISPKTLHGLDALGIALDATPRHPLSAQAADFSKADRIIALSDREHRPMVEQFFSSHESTVEYWEVGDLPVESPASAIEKMTRLVDHLLDELRPRHESEAAFAPTPAD